MISASLAAGERRDSRGKYAFGVRLAGGHLVGVVKKAVVVLLVGLTGIPRRPGAALARADIMATPFTFPHIADGQRLSKYSKKQSRSGSRKRSPYFDTKIVRATEPKLRREIGSVVEVVDHIHRVLLIQSLRKLIIVAEIIETTLHLLCRIQ